MLLFRDLDTKRFTVRAKTMTTPTGLLQCEDFMQFQVITQYDSHPIFHSGPMWLMSPEIILVRERMIAIKHTYS